MGTVHLAIGIIVHMVMAIPHLAIATIVPMDAMPVTLINFPRGATLLK